MAVNLSPRREGLTLLFAKHSLLSYRFASKSMQDHTEPQRGECAVALHISGCLHVHVVLTQEAQHPDAMLAVKLNLLTAATGLKGHKPVSPQGV